MIQTNFTFANTIWKYMIIKNLDYLFQNVFIESKASQNTPQIFQTEFQWRFYNNTRCNKINHMAALRMDWYSLISKHKHASRAMASECLMILDHLNREVEWWTFETISWQRFDCNFKNSNTVYNLSEAFQSLKIWAWSD